FYTFSIYYSADHRHLHSFPTRRSSDLAERAKSLWSGEIDRHAVLEVREALEDGSGGAARFALDAADDVQHHGRAVRRLVARPVRDRKSTRLNSSHVAISYAVFCLKKKK